MRSSSIKILTYNIHKGFSASNRQFVLYQMREQLQSADVDLVFLQEIQGQHKFHETKITNWPTASQFEFLADRIWPHYAYGENAIYNMGHHGNAILSKYPFVKWDNINVSSFRRASRSLLHGVINVPTIKNDIHLICVHLDFISFERRRQLKILNERIREHIPQDDPLILAGDFNDWQGQVDKYLGNDLKLIEVFKTLQGRYAKTYPAWQPFLPVDRIYYRDVEPVACKCLREKPWHRLSDHLPLYAEFRIHDHT